MVGQAEAQGRDPELGNAGTEGHVLVQAGIPMRQYNDSAPGLAGLLFRGVNMRVNGVVLRVGGVYGGSEFEDAILDAEIRRSIVTEKLVAIADGERVEIADVFFDLFLTAIVGARPLFRPLHAPVEGPDHPICGTRCKVVLPLAHTAPVPLLHHFHRDIY